MAPSAEVHLALEAEPAAVVGTVASEEGPEAHRTEGSAFSSKFRPIHASAVKPGGRASLLWDNNIVRIRPEAGA